MPHKGTRQMNRRIKATNEAQEALIIAEAAVKKAYEEIKIAEAVAVLMEQKNAATMAQEAAAMKQEATKDARDSAMISRIKAFKDAREQTNTACEALKDNPNEIVAALAAISNDEARDAIRMHVRGTAETSYNKAAENKKRADAEYAKFVNSYEKAIKQATSAAQLLDAMFTEEAVAKVCLSGAKAAISDYGQDKRPHHGTINAMIPFIKLAEKQVEAAEEATKKAQEAYTKAKQEVEAIKHEMHKASRDRTAAIEEHERTEKVLEKVEKILSPFGPLWGKV